MPHIILKRDDIPAATLQVLDLEPNESQRNLIYDPPGQSKYVDPVVRALPAVISPGAGIINILVEVSGLEAWLITNVADGGGASLTPAEAQTNADDILGLLAFGDLSSAAGILTVAAINGALSVGSITAGQLQALLDVLSGQTYTVPAGTQIEAGATLDVDPAIGADGGPAFGDIRRVFSTSSLALSVATGHLSGFVDNGFEYQGVGGTNGEAVAVYNDDGTLF
jgi:hypothetical protein